MRTSLFGNRSELPGVFNLLLRFFGYHRVADFRLRRSLNLEHRRSRADVPNIIGSDCASFVQALELAETWVRLKTNDLAVVMNEQTLKRPYRWVFFNQSGAYIAANDRREMLHGTPPIIIDRVSGNIRITGTGPALEEYLADYEATISRGNLTLSLPSEL